MSQALVLHPAAFEGASGSVPFPLIVEELYRQLLIFWVHTEPQTFVTGSMALRAHFNSSCRVALSSGMTDIDLMVPMDLGRFYSSIGYCAQVLGHFVSSTLGLNPAFLEFKVQQINKIIVAKFFWHTFRWGDVQWAQDSVPKDKVCMRPVFEGLVAKCMTLGALAEQSNQVIDGCHDGRPGDNSLRIAKDKSRLAVLSIPRLFCAALGASLDAPLDASLGAPLDASLDASLDVPLDASLDVPLDASLDASLDALLDTRINSRLSSLEAGLGRIEALREKLFKLVKDQHRQIQALRASNAALDTEVSNKQSSIRKLEHRVQSQREKLTQYESKINQLQTRLNESAQTERALYSRAQDCLVRAQSAEQTIKLRDDQIALYRASLHALERANQQLDTVNKRFLMVDRKFKEVQAHLESLVSQRRHERLLASSIIQTIILQNLSLSFSLNKAVEYTKTINRASHILYSVRHSLFRMFSDTEYDGIAFPQTLLRDDSTGEIRVHGEVTKEFGDFGRSDVASSAKVFVESLGPFENEEETSIMCGWRPNETMLDYISRINGYVALRMTSGWRAHLGQTAIDRWSKMKERNPVLDRCYMTSRSSYVRRSRDSPTEGGMCVRLDHNPLEEDVDEPESPALPCDMDSLDMDDLDIAARQRILKKETTPEQNDFDTEWMFEPIPALIVDVKRDLRSTPEKSTQPRPHLREDWLKDPSHCYVSLDEFCKIRSCANMNSTIAFSIMHRVSVSMTSRLHKHARIASELYHRLESNIEYMRSFNELFSRSCNKQMREYMDLISPMEEEAIIDSPVLQDIAQGMIKTYSMFFDSDHELVSFSKQLVERLIPNTMLIKGSTMTRDTFNQFLQTNVPGVSIAREKDEKEQERVELQNRLKKKINESRVSRSKRR